MYHIFAGIAHYNALLMCCETSFGGFIVLVKKKSKITLREGIFPPRSQADTMPIFDDLTLQYIGRYFSFRQISVTFAYA